MSEERPYIFAIDPGKATGYCLYDPRAERFEFQGEKPQFEFVFMAEEWLKQFGQKTTVVCESFTITVATAKNSAAPWSLEIIGAIRYLAEKYNAEFKLQSPADAKRFSTNEKLKRVGFYVPGKGHANDAKRHLLVELAKRGQVDMTKLVG